MPRTLIVREFDFVADGERRQCLGLEPIEVLAGDRRRECALQDLAKRCHIVVGNPSAEFEDVGTDERVLIQNLANRPDIQILRLLVRQRDHETPDLAPAKRHGDPCG